MPYTYTQFNNQDNSTRQACTLHKLENGPPTKATVTREDAIRFYKDMRTIRRMETMAGNLYKAKQIRGFCHLYSGQVCQIKNSHMFFIFEYKNIKFDEQYFENEPFVISKENTIILKIILSATIITSILSCISYLL